MLKSVLPFASNHSQNYFVKVFQASFADWYLFIQDRIFKCTAMGAQNVPRWVVITSYYHCHWATGVASAIYPG
jgi:hypothetical protein